ncbi:FAD-dependent oxidoreductase [Chloroflexota bacterium]
MSHVQVFDKLFEPGRIGSLELKNRIVMASMGTGLESINGEVTPALVRWFERRARGGMGLILTGAFRTSTVIDPVRSQPSALARVDDSGYMPGLYSLAEAVHDAGSKICIQLSPGGGAQSSGGSWKIGEEFNEDVGPVGPSPVPAPLVEKMPRELTTSEVERIVQLFGFRTGQLSSVGFDGISVHAHAGYLVSEFLSPYFNKRRDKYGGSQEGRFRFLLELVESARANTPQDLAIIVKYSIDEFLKGGGGIKEAQALASRLQQAGVDAIDISAGGYGSTLPVTAPMYFGEGYMVPLSKAIKEVVNIPVIVSGRLDNPVMAEQVLKDGKADFIGMGRPLIADPDLPLKVADGRTEQIRRCISCNTCRENVVTLKPIRCAVNAVAGREEQYESITPARKKKKVMVIGGGPAGMEAARVAALRGHSVTLYEKDDALGGQLKLAAVPPHKDILRRIINFYSVAFQQLGNLKVQLGIEVNAGEIAREKPDVVIVATGGEPLIPEIKGAGKSNVITAFQALDGAKVGKRVVVIGGNLVGCETANFFSERGKEVTIVKRRPGTIGGDMERWTQAALTQELSEKGVRVIDGHDVEAITDDGIVTINKEGQKTAIGADTIVLARGLKPVNRLAEEATGLAREVYLIGDAMKPGRIQDAISRGYVMGYTI